MKPVLANIALYHELGVLVGPSAQAVEVVSAFRLRHRGVLEFLVTLGESSKVKRGRGVCLRKKAEGEWSGALHAESTSSTPLIVSRAEERGLGHGMKTALPSS